MQRGDRSYRRSENCETAVNKCHHNAGSQLSVKMLWLLLHLYEFFKLCFSKLRLFLEFDCRKYYNGNRKVRKVFYEKISDTTYVDSI